MSQSVLFILFGIFLFFSESSIAQQSCSYDEDCPEGERCVLTTSVGGGLHLLECAVVEETTEPSGGNWLPVIAVTLVAIGGALLIAAFFTKEVAPPVAGILGVFGAIALVVGIAINAWNVYSVSTEEEEQCPEGMSVADCSFTLGGCPCSDPVGIQSNQCPIIPIGCCCPDE